MGYFDEDDHGKYESGMKDGGSLFGNEQHSERGSKRYNQWKDWADDKARRRDSREK